MSSARSLFELQETDQQLALHRRRLRNIVIEIKKSGGLPDLKAGVEKARLSELEAKVEAARLESEMASLTDQVTKLEERLYSGSITNVRELNALETEHNTSRRKRARVEEAIPASKSTSEDATQTYSRLRSELTEKQNAWGKRLVDLKENHSNVGSEYKRIEVIRDSASKDIPLNDMTVYNALLPRTGGVAVVRVERGVCQGCRVRLPIGEISTMLKSVEMVNCSNCGRILLAD